MAGIPNPWFSDLPPSFQTEERKYIKISSEASNTGNLILKNGAADTRLENLRKEELDIIPKWQELHHNLELLNKAVKYQRADWRIPQDVFKKMVRQYYWTEEQESKLRKHMDLLREVIWYLEYQLDIPLSRSPIPTMSRSQGLVKEDLVV